jgi:aspartate/methionine/tyrosine aminotransferase
LRNIGKFSLKEIKFSKNVARIDTSGIRKIFEAAGSSSINLGLGQQDFDTPEHIKAEATKSICSISPISSISYRSIIFILDIRIAGCWEVG